MTGPLTVHLADLADRLADLRQRLKEAARLEVARAVGEAFRDAAHTMICGPVRTSPHSRAQSQEWDDPWSEPAYESHYSETSHERSPAFDTHMAKRPQLALAAGLSAARFCFSRTRTLGPTLAVGLLVAAATYVGGSRLQPLLDVCLSTNELLHLPDDGIRR